MREAEKKGLIKIKIEIEEKNKEEIVRHIGSFLYSENVNINDK